jgi:NTE family protein
MGPRDIVRSVSIFASLSEQESTDVLEHATGHRLKTGEVLVREGDPSDAVFIVLSGRFSVFVPSLSEPVAEVSVGELIGEIGFFAGHARTATVVAARDSEVIKLDRAAFAGIVKRIPHIYEIILASLADRLAETTARVSINAKHKAPRTAAIVMGGSGGVGPGFVERLRSVFGRRGRTLILGSADMAARFQGMSPDHPAVSRWLNAA